MMSNELKSLLSMFIAAICFMTAGFLFYESRLISLKKYDESFLYHPTKEIFNKLTEAFND